MNYEINRNTSMLRTFTDKDSDDDNGYYDEEYRNSLFP